jgi:hypothetical protein
MRKLPTTVSVVSGLAVVGGVAALIFFVIGLVQGGVRADVTGTSGEITAGELVPGVLGMGLIGIGVAGLIVAAVLFRRRSDRRAP